MIIVEKNFHRGDPPCPLFAPPLVVAQGYNWPIHIGCSAAWRLNVSVLVLGTRTVPEWNRCIARIGDFGKLDIKVNDAKL